MKTLCRLTMISLGLAPLAAQEPSGAPRVETTTPTPAERPAAQTTTSAIAPVATAPNVPVAGGEMVADAGQAVRPPWERLRYAAPEGLAPQVGYAPQAGAPLPGYPGVAHTASGATGYPSRTVGTGQMTNLFTDLKASAVGDVLTIVITQNAVAAANAQKDSSRKADIAFNGGAGLLQILPSFGLTFDSGSTGSTNDTSSFNVATTFTVTVVEVAPNGNLIVEGQQVVNMDGRDQWVKIRGEVRPYDVTPENTVESTRVANVRIEFVGTRARQKRKGLFDVVVGAIESLFGIFF